MTPFKSKTLAGLSIGLSSVLAWSQAQADYTLNMTQGVTPISREIYDLHMIVFWICVAIGVVVFGAMAYSIMNHRKSKGAEAASFHESTTVEIIWTLVPLLILIAIAVPATKTLLKLEDTSKSDVVVQATGLQWKWKYKYHNEGIEFISNLSQKSRDAIKGSDAKPDHYLLDVDNELVLPINKKIRFLFDSGDVIHAWWVPELGVKQDAIPGFINDSWATITKPGIYRGQCAELCGKDHGFMPVVVRAVSEADYAKWVAKKKAEASAAAAAANEKWSMEKLLAQGKKVYGTNCAGCHGATGAGVPGAFPAMTGSKIATGDVKAHIDMVFNGSKKNPAMTAYKNLLSDSDIAAVITYERNALGNKVGDTVQPSDIKKLR